MRSGNYIVSSRLEAERKKLNLSQADLAALMFCNTSTITRLERSPNKSVSGYGFVRTLARMFGVSNAYLVGTSDDMQPLIAPTAEEAEMLALLHELDPVGRAVLIDALKAQIKLMRVLRGNHVELRGGGGGTTKTAFAVFFRACLATGRSGVTASDELM
jgi:transcriptional regulator with XRE-family HTH domain